jgi:hypothetical protein
MALEKGLIQPMAPEGTGQRANTSHGTEERADTSYGTREYWTKG